MELNIYAAANRADINLDDDGKEFLTDLHEMLIEAIDATEDPEAAWAGIVEDPGYGPNHENLGDFTSTIASDAVSRLVYYSDIIRLWAGVDGWAWEDADLVECSTIDRMRWTLERIAEAFLYATYAELREEVAA